MQSALLGEQHTNAQAFAAHHQFLLQGDFCPQQRFATQL